MGDGGDASLKRMLTDLLDRAPSGDEMLRARRLFARAIETPGGLKVQTIHAFCERLLQRFPLEAGVPPGFEILDDQGRAALLREAVDEMLSRGHGGASRCAAGALARVGGRVRRRAQLR